ncbi:MAG: tRNA uridine-5-carboxymethylaminomethyl(34) synthesis GTPase MnmE, partial [Terriglobales bacterium]
MSIETAAHTIVAIATPAGRGGLGMVRLSGVQAQAIAESLLGRALQPRQARVARFCDRDGALLDQVVAVLFPAPQSATAEDVVEITAHGSPVLLQALVAAAVGAGARPAQPGEFTRRAFLNGKLDLSQAEAVGDLIAAQTLLQARTAAQQLGGSVARLLAPAHRALVHLIARLEAGIDFAEDDVAVPDDAPLAAEMARLREELARLQAGVAPPLREGLAVALVGRPNVGKSSLFNRLLEQARAIVTAQPGTTRDLVESSMDWDGIPVRLVDTAGIREPEAEAERLGIEKSWEAAADADVVLAVLDASAAEGEAERALRQKVAALPRA